MRAIALTACALALAGRAGAAETARKAIFALSVNRVELAPALVYLRGNDVLVPLEDLEAAGLSGLGGAREKLDDRLYVSLASLAPGLVYELDDREVAIRIFAEPRYLPRTKVDLRAARPGGIVFESIPSAFLNYALQLDDHAQLSAFGEAAASFRGALAWSGFSREAGGRLLRGFSNVSYDQPDRLRRFTFGDTVCTDPSAAGLGGALVAGGVGVVREFSLDPYYLPQQYPSGVATALFPSIVDVYVNGALVRSQPVAPGTVEFTGIPVTQGSNEVRYVVRDPFGRSVEQQFSPYYSAAGALEKGASDYGYTLGLRRDDLQSSFRYGAPVFFGRHRAGLTEALTVGARLEAGLDFVSGGPALTARLPFGQADLAVSASRQGRMSGAAASLGYGFISAAVSAGGRLRALGRRYANASLAPGDDRALLGLDAFVSVPLAARASVTANFALVQARDAGRTERLSLQGSWHLGSLTANVTAGVSGAGPDLILGLVTPFGERGSAGAYYQRQAGTDSAQVQLQQSPPPGTGFGYRADGAMGPSASGDAGVQARSPYGVYEARVTRAGGVGSATFAASGALVAMGGGMFFTRPVENGYALVQVGELPGVRTWFEGQEIGSTDSHGRLVIPTLLPYYGNRVRISGEDVPLRYELGRAELLAASPYRGGARVRFPVRQIRAVRGRLAVEEAPGKLVVPAFGEVRIPALAIPSSPVARDGEFYLENVPEGLHDTEVRYGGGVCLFQLAVPAFAAETLDLRQVTCRRTP